MRNDIDLIKARTLLILGEPEMIYNNRQSAVKSARALIPSLKVAMIPNAHHIAAVAQPDLVNQRLLCFLTD